MHAADHDTDFYAQSRDVLSFVAVWEQLESGERGWAKGEEGQEESQGGRGGGKGWEAVCEDFDGNVGHDKACMQPRTLKADLVGCNLAPSTSGQLLESLKAVIVPPLHRNQLCVNDQTGGPPCTCMGCDLFVQGRDCDVAKLCE